METQVHTRWQFVWRCAGLRILWDSSMQQRNGDCCGTGSRTSLFNDCHQGLHMIPLIEGHDYFVWNIEWEQIPEVDVLPAPKNICRKKKGRYLSHSRIKMRKKIPVGYAQIGSQLHSFHHRVWDHLATKIPVYCLLLNCSAYHFPFMYLILDSHTCILI